MAIMDKEQEKRQRALNKLELKQVKDDMAEVLETPAGMRLLAWILKSGHLFTNAMTGNEYTYFNEGARNLVNKLLLFMDDDKAAELMNLARPKMELDD